MLRRSDLFQRLKADMMRHCQRPQTGVIANERGSVAPILAAVLLMGTAGAALAVDIARAYSMKSDFQAAADAAALAAAVMLPDEEAARRAAKRAISKNLPNDSDLLRAEDFEFGHWHAASGAIVEGDGANSAVRVTVQRASSRGNGIGTLFAGVLGRDTIDVSASAAAGKRGVSCLIALDPKGKGLEMNGDAHLELIECGAHVNAKDKDALKVNGKSTLLADSICVSGRSKIDGGADVMPLPSEYCPPHADPLVGVAMPPVAACTDNEVEFKDETRTLTADRVFCGGLKIEGESHITLQPGVYVIDNGKLEVKDETILEGDGVTILLRGEDAELDVKDEASIRLTAPTDGVYQGLLLVQSQGADKENKWDSEAASELTGVVYLPDGRFTSKISSHITGTSACFVLIAKEIKLEGEAEMSIDLSSSACRNSLPSAFSRSVVLLS